MHPEWVPEPWPACLGSCLEIAGFMCVSTVLASLSGCNRIIGREPVVVPPATLERHTGYLLPTLRVGVAIGREWEDLIPPALARANPSLMQPRPCSPCEHQHCKRFLSTPPVLCDEVATTESRVSRSAFGGQGWLE